MEHMKPSTRLTLVVLLCLVAAGAGAQCRFRNTAFSAGETLSYNLYYNWKFVWVKAGTASMAIANSHYTEAAQLGWKTAMCALGIAGGMAIGWGLADFNRKLRMIHIRHEK